MTNMGMASVRKVHPLFFMTYIYQQQEERVCHKSVTHPFLFFAFSQIRNL